MSVTVVRDQAEKRKGLGHYLHTLDTFNNVGDAEEREYARHVLERMYNQEKRALTVNSGTSGGYLVPETVAADIRNQIAETAIIRPRATVLPMDAESVLVPEVKPTSTGAGTPSYYGALVPSWTAEGATLSDSTGPAISAARLVAHELTATFKVSRSLLQNAPALNVALPKLIAQAAGFVEDLAFLVGSGNSQPIGVTGAKSLITSTARGLASAISFADLRSMWTRMIPGSRNKAIWVISQAAENVLLSGTGATTPMGYPITFTPGGESPYALFGRPAFVSEKLPALNTLGDVLLIDPSYYVVGDRLSLEIMVSEEVAFQSNQAVFRLIHRVAGVPWPSDVITLADGTTTASPFVALGTV